MTEEEAAELVVTTGVNKGWTMAQVSEQRPSSLKYYAYLCEDCGNIMKAAAMLLMGGSQQLKASCPLSIRKFCVLGGMLV